MKLNYGERAAREVSQRLAAPVASMTELKSIPADRRVDGMLAICVADGSMWRFHGTSGLTGDDILVAAPTLGSGRWLRCPGGALLVCPFTFAKVDATLHLTVPAGCYLHILEAFWRVDADFTGGSSSSIGVSSSNKTSLTTKGDVLGGSGGDVAATLVASDPVKPGTIGAAWGTLAQRRVVWEPGETLRHDRITSAFTAGSGALLLSVNILQNAGA